MNSGTSLVRALALCVALGMLAGCGSKDSPAPQAPTASTPGAPAAPDSSAAPAATPVTAEQVSRTWTAEALEELLAPVALYPDPVLSQVLIASTNPQEVLDAGNWLLQNQGLKGDALDEAAAGVGFTPPVRALVQFPETVDMMCLELGWTTEVGEAFVADQAGVLAAVQRLRRQAMDVGNLQSSAQMKVETELQEGEEVVVLKPAQPEIVYVPQYDPVAAYAPPPPATAAAPATTTTTTVEEKSGHSTGALITTGLLSFGAGILVSEIFDDDDDDRYGYYYPNYGYGGMPYYPPYPYRPVYGSGFRPGYSYNRPPNYNSGFQNTGNIVINTGGNRPGDGYWDRYEDKKRPGEGYQRPRDTKSPISAARPGRPELNDLSAKKARPMPADVRPPSPTATAANWKGQSGYAGARPQDRAKQGPQERIAAASPGYSKPAKAKPASRDVAKAPPKVQGSYAGASYDRSKIPQSKPATRDVKPPKPATRDLAPPKASGGDRGYSKPAKPADKPAAQPKPVNRPAPSAGAKPARNTAVSGTKAGNQDRAASQRGKQSLPQGARSKGGGKKKR
jgi:hypothetical protein